MPGLALDALRSHIKSRKFAPVYLLFGEDVRLLEQQVDAIEATIDPADRAFAFERLFAGEQGGSPVDVAAAANVFPMLGDRRVVVLMRAERLLKPKRAAKAGEDTEDAPEEESVDGDGGMFDSLVRAISLGKSIEGLADKSPVVQELMQKYLGVGLDRGLPKAAVSANGD